MNRTVFIVVAGFLSVIVVILFMMSFALQVRKEEMANANPTPLPSLSPTFIPDNRPTVRPTITTAPELTVMDTFPLDNATDVPIHNAYIDIIFNKNDFEPQDFIFSIRPDTKYKLDYSQRLTNSTLRVQFLEPLQPNTQYTFRVNTLKLIPKNYMFTTQQATESATIN